MIFNINHKINQFLMKRILHLYDRNNLSDCELCYSISKPISNEEDTLKSFITFDITPYMPIFRMVVGSQIVTPKQILLIITIKIIHLYLQQARDQSKGGTIFSPFSYIDMINWNLILRTLSSPVCIRIWNRSVSSMRSKDQIMPWQKQDQLKLQNYWT